MTEPDEAATLRDDEAWFDALAGRVRADPSSAAREGRALREELLDLSARADAGAWMPAAGPDAAREEQLIARARGAGLLPPARVFFFRRPVQVAMAAAAVFVFALIVGVSVRRQAFQRPEPGSDATRGVIRGAPGTPGGVVRLQAADPAALQQEIVAALAGCGVKATAYERLGRKGIDADLPVPMTAEAAAVLRKYGLPESPADGVLKVEIEPQAAP